jgi:signal transduction histidine kinase
MVPHRSSQQNPRSLSRRVLAWTFALALLIQIAVYVPLVAAYHRELLDSRIAAAQTAVLALEEAQNNEVSPKLREELLANAGVQAVALKRDEARILILAGEKPGTVSRLFDLRGDTWLKRMGDAVETLWAGGGRVVRIVDSPRLGGGQFIEAIADERPIHDALSAYAWRSLLLSLGLALALGSLVFLAIHLSLVRPIQKLILAMTSFREAPEEASRVLVPSVRGDEIGAAERALADMQEDIRQSLSQKAHLAAMGMAVAKINHDLRNMLSGAQIMSERLEASQDEQVRTLAPRLLNALDRAITLTSATLSYGGAAERRPRPALLNLGDIVQEAAAAAGALENDGLIFNNHIDDGFNVWADSEHLFRILLNLLRNAVRVLEARGVIDVSALLQGGLVIIDVGDDGPGIPDDVLPRLFQPFGGGARVKGTGLGLAIARELARNHGGELSLLRTGTSGTVFRITLPANENAVRTDMS